MNFGFEKFVLDADRRELTQDGQPVSVQPQVFDLLQYIIENHDHVVTRDDLIEHVWNGRIVSESTLATRINAARKALSDNGTDQRLIRTVHGKGIRFVGQVDPTSATLASATVQTTEKANLYVPVFSCADADTTEEEISAELHDKLASGFAGDPLYSLILDHPPVDGSTKGYHLSGVFHSFAEVLRLSVKLSNIETSSLIWAEQFEFPIRGNASALSNAADKINGRTYADLHLDRSSRAKTKDLNQSDATDLYYKSRSLIRSRIPAENFAAEKLVRRSIEMAPELFGGHMGLAVLYLVRTTAVWSKDILGDLEICRQAANAAAGASEKSVGPKQMLAYCSAYKRQFSAAMDYVTDCERLGQNQVTVQTMRGVMLSYQGQFDEALAILLSGQRTDADQQKSYVLNIGRTHFMAGDYDRAIPKLEKFSSQCPAADLVQLFLGNCYDATSQKDKAQACVTTQLSLCPHTTIERISHVTPYPDETLASFRAFLRNYDVPEI